LSNRSIKPHSAPGKFVYAAYRFLAPLENRFKWQATGRGEGRARFLTPRRASASCGCVHNLNGCGLKCRYCESSPTTSGRQSRPASTRSAVLPRGI